MALHEFKAIENGTISTKSTPYAFVEKGQIVHLHDEDLAMYEGCTWLLPIAKANAVREKPLMSNLVHTPRGLSGVEAMSQLTTPAVNPHVASDAVHESGRKNKGKAVEETTGGDEAQEGTGNQDAI